MPRLLLAIALCFALCGGAVAQDAPPFGEPGQWVIDGSVGFSMRFRTWEQEPRSPLMLLGLDELSLWMSPTALLFVAKDLAVGAYLSLGIDRYDREDGSEFDANNFGGGASIAYRVGLGARAFLLPQLGGGAVYVDRTERLANNGVLGGGRGLSASLFQAWRTQGPGWISGSMLQASLYVPLAFVIAPRFYVGGGPFARVVHSPEGLATPRGDTWDYTIGIETTFGTWL